MVSTSIDEREDLGLGGSLWAGRSPSGPEVASIVRIAAIIGLLLALCSGLWAIAEYAQHRALIRQAETDRYIRAFEAGPVADAWATLSRSWEAPDPDPHAARVEPDLSADVETVLTYFRGFAVCVRAGICDPERARSYLGELPWRFHNEHRDELEEAFPGVPLDRDFAALAPRGERPLLGP